MEMTGEQYLAIVEEIKELVFQRRLALQRLVEIEYWVESVGQFGADNYKIFDILTKESVTLDGRINELYSLEEHAQRFLREHPVRSEDIGVYNI